jgi:protein-disulfide isomerase
LLDYDGRVRLVVKDFPLPSHPAARAAHEAARCAAAAGRFWPYHDRLYDAQPRFERDDLIRYAADVGLDPGPVPRCLDSRSFAAAVEADVSQGRALGVRSTPTFFVNGQILVGAQPLDAFRRAVDEALAARSR